MACSQRVDRTGNVGLPLIHTKRLAIGTFHKNLERFFLSLQNKAAQPVARTKTYDNLCQRRNCSLHDVIANSNELQPDGEAAVRCERRSRQYLTTEPVPR